MEFKASLKNLHVSPQKLRVLTDAVKGKKAQDAIDILHFAPRKWARTVENLIRSAVSNSQGQGGNVDSLYVKNVLVDKAVTRRSFMTRARGGSSRLLKRHSHVTVVLDEKN